MSIYKKIFLAIVLLFATIVSVSLSYIAIPLYGHELFMYPSETSLNPFLFILPFICLSLMFGFIVCSSLFDKAKYFFYWIIVCCFISIILLRFNGSENVKSMVLKQQYEAIEKNTPKFLNTNKGKILTVAYKEKDFENFNLILKDIKEILPAKYNELNNVLKITKNILPEIKEEVLNALSDDYFTEAEYRHISKLITEKLTNKELNSEQIVLLKNMNFKI
jgi:hypothetical protein